MPTFPRGAIHTVEPTQWPPVRGEPIPPLRSIIIDTLRAAPGDGSTRTEGGVEFVKTAHSGTSLMSALAAR